MDTETPLERSRRKRRARQATYCRRHPGRMALIQKKYKQTAKGKAAEARYAVTFHRRMLKRMAAQSPACRLRNRLYQQERRERCLG